ncbi:hypothetical protein D3C84_751660 [compost metagenome]
MTDSFVQHDLRFTGGNVGQVLAVLGHYVLVFVKLGFQQDVIHGSFRRGFSESFENALTAELVRQTQAGLEAIDQLFFREIGFDLTQ